MAIETKYMDFIRVDVGQGKTQRWTVWNKNGPALGDICWYGGWRQYVFQPCSLTEFNHSCLTDIATFLQRLNSEHKLGPQ